jgi:hypothetical protein
MNRTNQHIARNRHGHARAFSDLINLNPGIACDQVLHASLQFLQSAENYSLIDLSDSHFMIVMHIADVKRCRSLRIPSTQRRLKPSNEILSWSAKSFAEHAQSPSFFKPQRVV